ncbi:hypothetical protein NH340_JMT04687 [Sarcoptes scabiei]|nr:hypothetical protein NH340_JMT04687 [Sarcoptes scabiei]
MSTSFFRSGMAPYRNSAQNSLSSNVNDSSIEVERDIWSSILRQVQQTANNKLPANKSILVLGDNDSGKTSLIAKMQGIDATCKGSGLEYHYLMVRDEYRDEQTQCGVWIIDGKYQWKSQLLRFALNADNFQDSTILLICSMTKPWNIMSSLEYWMDCLSEHVKSLNIDPKKFKEYQELNQKRFQDYISPGDEIEGLSTLRLSHDDSDPSNNIESIDHDQLPPDVLCHNLGLDIVIVITKTDYMSTLEKEYDFKEEHFDFIQQSVRKFCLKYGATLMYVSAKINKNCDLLYKYLIHRIYGLKFKTPALVVEKDAVFIPAGWDSEKKISILHDNIQTFSIDSPYNDVIMCPPFVNTVVKEPESIAEDDQVFLMKLRTQIQQPSSNANTPLRGVSGQSSTGNTPIGGSSVSSIVKTDRRQSQNLPSGSSSSTPAASSFFDASGGEGMLQSFFNSLLTRKPVSGASSNSPANSQISQSRISDGSGGVTMAAESLRGRDVHAELERIIEDTKLCSTDNKDNI